MQNAEAADERNVVLYPPGWVDRFTAWVARLPVPDWTFYVALWLVPYLIGLATQWASGAITFYPFQLYFAGAIAFILALIRYLDRTADAALSRFRPMLNCSDAEYAEMRYRLTTLPARSTLLVTLLGVMLGSLGEIALPPEWASKMLHFPNAPSSLYYYAVMNLLTWCFVVIFAYHTLHQLIEVRHIYPRARVNLFDLGGLYPFSDLSARTAIGLQAFVSLWFILAPELLSNVFSLGLGVLLSAISLLTFVWPLLGIHNLLVDEKDRLLGETSKQFEVIIAELHRRNDNKEFQAIDDMHKTMASLEIENGVLDRISTWPWQTDTLRTVTAAVLLPMIVWIAQLLFQRALGA